MAWDDRLRTAAYTAPSGIRTQFDYEDVHHSFEKRTAAFEFPDADGSLIQDLGRSGRRFPLRVFFSGADCDLEAEAFMDALGERGQGRLEHPIYGVHDVVPFGLVTRRDDLKTRANQAIVETSFWETINVIYPTGQSDASAFVLAALEEFIGFAAEEFANELGLGSVVDAAIFKNIYNQVLTVTTNTLEDIAATQSDVENQFNEISASINAGLDTLVGTPLALAAQTSRLIQAPARALTSITARLGAYGSLVNQITGANTPPQTFNDFKTLDLYTPTYVTGSVLSVVNNQFETKPAAIEAAEIIFQQFDKVTVWRDDNYRAFQKIDTGGAYQALQEAVALAAGFLVEISFTLKQERRVVLGRDRTVIDLVGELYGEIDGQLDFLISSNDLTGSEILELPRGKEIVYYV